MLKNQQKQVRREVKQKLIAGINKDELILLTFRESDLNTKLTWKHSREFQFQGEFYDIVEKQIQGDSISYWCWWDNEETQLSRKLDHLMAMHWNQNQNHKQDKEQIQQFYKNLYFEELSQPQVSFNPAFKKADWSYKKLMQSIAVAPHVPPPRNG